MTPINAEIKVKNLDHLGLIAGIIDELGIADTINDLVGIQPGEIVSAGVVVKAIFQAENKKLKYYQLNLVKLIKFKEKSSKNNVDKIEASFRENNEIIAAEKKRAGRFVLATNILESQQLSKELMLLLLMELNKF